MSLVLGMDFFFGCGDGCGPLNGVFQPPGGKPLGALGGSTLDPSVAKFSAAALPGEDGGLYCAAGPCCQRGMALSAAGGALSGYCLGCPPAQDASHHQDYNICSRESQTKPSFATGILGGGDNPRYCFGGHLGRLKLFLVIFLV